MSNDRNCLKTDKLAKPPFISKGYYVPVVLSNGVDFCQLDFSGSMSWEEHIKGYVSYWYKDSAIIGKRFEMMEDCVRFVIEFALKQGDCGPYLKELISIDESGKKKRNELLTTMITLRGIEILKAAAALLSRPVSDDILRAEPALRDVLKSLEMKHGYAPYEGGGSGSWGNVVPFIHSPDKRKFGKSIDFALDGCEEAYGLNVGRTSRMRCATFPWVEGIFAWAMLRNNDKRAKKYFMNMQRFTNFHGGFAEHIWIHGEPSRE
ncbi:MAG: hypothetical protein WCP55_19415, partial [Lentisphaerota bacterium]